MKTMTTLPTQTLQVWDKATRTFRKVTVKHEPRERPVRRPNTTRRAVYLKQTGRRVLTPAQRRRLRHKENH